MADEEQVKRLLAGVKGWNRWRKENPGVGVDLSRAKLVDTNLAGADLTEADLTEADLTGASLGNANLAGAKLLYAYLYDADLARANLVGADFKLARCTGTSFSDLDLLVAKNLETTEHYGPSTIGTDTLVKSRGRIPEAFLRGAGLQDWEILAAKLHDPELRDGDITDITYEISNLRTRGPILISPLFISYSHKDTAFVEAVEKRLDEKGIRYWRDVHHATAGRLEKIIDQAMTLNPTVLLVLSENSVESDWVEWEARKARKLEKELKRDVLCPVRLDESCFECDWPERLREQIFEYNVLDFSRWEEAGVSDKMFGRLLEGLGAFYRAGD